MNSFQLNDLTTEKYGVFIEDLNNSIILNFEGAISDSNPETHLNPVFKTVHQTALTHQLKTVYCSMKKLQYINSRGLRTFLNWITDIKTAPPEKQYKIIFTLNQNEGWQQTSFIALFSLYQSMVEFISE